MSDDLQPTVSAGPLARAPAGPLARAPAGPLARAPGDQRQQVVRDLADALRRKAQESVLRPHVTAERALLEAAARLEAEGSL